jgi:hypothetical protein
MGQQNKNSYASWILKALPTDRRKPLERKKEELRATEEIKAEFREPKAPTTDTRFVKGEDGKQYRVDYEWQVTKDPETGKQRGGFVEVNRSLRTDPARKRGRKFTVSNTKEGVVTTDNTTGESKLSYPIRADKSASLSENVKFMNAATELVNMALENPEKREVISNIFKDVGWDFNVTKETEVRDYLPDVTTETPSLVRTPEGNGVTWERLFKEFTTKESRKFIQLMKKQGYSVQETQQEAINRFMGQ